MFTVLCCTHHDQFKGTIRTGHLDSGLPRWVGSRENGAPTGRTPYNKHQRATCTAQMMMSLQWELLNISDIPLPQSQASSKSCTNMHKRGCYSRVVFLTGFRWRQASPHEQRARLGPYRFGGAGQTNPTWPPLTQALNTFCFQALARFEAIAWDGVDSVDSAWDSCEVGCAIPILANRMCGGTGLEDFDW